MQIYNDADIIVLGEKKLIENGTLCSIIIIIMIVFSSLSGTSLVDNIFDIGSV